MKKKILCSAIYVNDGKKHVHQPKNIDIGFVVCGRRHHNCFYTLSLMYKDLRGLDKTNITQGFLTECDNFVDIKESFEIAIHHNQLKTEVGSVKLLTSEDII